MINKIKLSNWKTHSEISLEFKKGINILVGPMGSGKSSILQGICYAFFGFIPESKKKEIKISELIKRGSVGPATVEVDFLHKGELFKIIRTISTNKNEAIVRDKDNLLLAGTNPSQVNEFLKNHLKLDEDVFLRTVYAKQNEIDLFLQLNPQERKVRLDDLMALNKYENARKSCVKLVNLLSAKKEEKENFLKNFNISEISDEISKLKSEIENLENENKNCATEYSKNLLEKELIEKKIKELRSKFENYKKLEAEQKFLVNQINELNLKIPKEIANKEILEKNLQEHQSSLMNFEEKKREINKKLNEANNQRISLEKESSFIESKQADIELRLEQIAISELELKNLYENCGVKDIGKELENAIAEEKEINMKLASVESEIRLTKKHLDELSTAEGVCPTCLRALEKNTKEKLIRARKEFIEQKVSEIENYTKLKLEIEDKIEKLQNILEQSKELVNNISKKAELENQKKTFETQIKNCQERLKHTLNQIENYKKEVEEIDNKLALTREVVSNLKEKISLAELNESKIKYEKRLEEIRILLKQKPDEKILEDAEKTFEKILQRCEELKSKINNFTYIIEEKKKRLLEFEKQKDIFDKTLHQISNLQKKIEFLQQLKNALLLTQEFLRKELISAVNEIMNNIWSFIYPYNKWTGIRLNVSDNDYILELKSLEGDWIPVVGFASGGERMLAALTLRLALAKILASEFNILILDEPTHNLDQTAIETLILALQEKLAEFLDQLFIVTHEEKLAEVGDNVIKLEIKNK